MPTYQPAEHGLQLSWERLEAAYVAPLQRAMLHHLELYHPRRGCHRFVADEVDSMATLEADAPDDAGATVEWIAAPLKINPKRQSDDGDGSWHISLDGVAGLMEIELADTRESLEPWELRCRIYASDDRSGPAQLPIERCFLDSVHTVGAAVQLKLDLSDSVNINIPGLTFKRREYPSLQR